MATLNVFHSYSALDRRRALWAYLFLAPAMLGLVLFRLYPIARAAYESLHDSDLLMGTGPYVGLGNYRELFDSDIFWRSARTTAIYTLGNTVAVVVLGLALALLLNRPQRGMRFFRSLYFLPIVVSLAIASTVWTLIYAVQGGLLNGVLQTFGIGQQPFLRSSSQALPSVMVMHIWHGLGYYVVLFIAGLQSIPAQLLEAARVDGAGRWRAFRDITLPMLRRVIAFVVVLGTVGYFTTFVPAYLMTRGGPRESTNLLAYHIYQQVFIYLRSGYGAALAIVMLLMVLSLVLVELRLLRAGDDE